MHKTLRDSFSLLSMAFCLAILLTFVGAIPAFAAPESTWSGVTTGTANVRSGPTTGATRVAIYAAGTHVTVYASVHGQTVWGESQPGIVSPARISAPRYIYGPLVAHTGGSGSPPAPSGQGKVIVVNRANNVQRLYAYQNGKLVLTAPVTTGSLHLQTFLGTWHIYRKLRDVWFHSPWPQGSPYYFAPVFVHYAMDYDGALFLHDATWRGLFGPGTDRPHLDPKLGWTDGSHGCIEMSLSNAQWLYTWAGVGTTVTVID